MNRKQKRMLARILVAGALLVALWVARLSGGLQLAASIGVYLIIGYDILLKAARGLLRGAVMDENFLMAIASVGVFALGICRGSGDYDEAIAVVLLYQLGELFQSCAVARSRRDIAALMDIRPDVARVEREGGAVLLPPEEVRPGSVIIVQPGERVPLDGEVLEGESALNMSALTGESLPREVAPGAAILSGSINLQGLLRIRTTREFGDSTATRILELVEEAASRKSSSERFISKFARVYTPLVCGCAALLAVAAPGVRLCLGLPAEWEAWLYRALIFLVISCPCALVISIPLSFFAGIGRACRAGVLIKGAQFIETLARARTVAFDKTGTLTRGVFEVAEVRPCGMTRGELLEYAALAESASGHPIARSLQAAYGAAPQRERVRDICEHAGRGITARVDDRPVAVGSARLLQELGLCPPEMPEGAGTAVHVAVDGAYAGFIRIADAPKPQARESLRRLRALGVRRCVMISGDNAATARAVAAELGIAEAYGGLLPAQKVELVERLLAETPRGSLIYVGDGVNDAPVLSRADVGIAMGALGQDAAIEAADVVLMHDDPLQVPLAIRLSRRCLSIVYQNIVLALGVKFACLALGACGLANMWLAIFADVGVAIIAILNALRR